MLVGRRFGAPVDALVGSRLEMFDELPPDDESLPADTTPNEGLRGLVFGLGLGLFSVLAPNPYPLALKLCIREVSPIPGPAANVAARGLGFGLGPALPPPVPVRPGRYADCACCVTKLPFPRGLVCGLNPLPAAVPADELAMLKLRACGIVVGGAGNACIRRNMSLVLFPSSSPSVPAETGVSRVAEEEA